MPLPNLVSPGVAEAEDPDSAAVATALEEDILLGRLLPRERLLGEALAARFGVSRNAVRRAFATLAQRGIVVLSPNRGAQVRDFAETEIAEMIEARAVLQRHAAGRIPMPAPAALLDLLGAHAEAHAAAIAARNLPEVLARNAAFHDAMFRSAGNAMIAATIAHLSWLLTVVRAYRAADPVELTAGARGHAEMLLALRAGDRAALLAAIEAHVSPASAIAARRAEWSWRGEVIRLG